MTCDLGHLDGAYVLGALAPEERLEFERHLAGCPACSSAVRDLAGLPGLLAQVAPEVLESTPEAEPPPQTLLPALVREVRRSQHRRRWAVGLAAAAAVTALGVGSAAVLTQVGNDGRAPTAASSLAPAREMTPIGQHHIGGDLALTPVAWGTRLDLTCRYEQQPGGYHDQPPATYALVVRRVGGGTERVATWRALPGRTMHVTGATALTTGQIAAVEVRTGTGQRVLALRG